MRLTLRSGSLHNAETGEKVAVLPAPSDPERRVQQANRWRDQYNPLRGITFPTAVSWMEQCQRGCFADFQWGCHFIERRDPDLLAIIERRTGMLTQMDWDIRTVEKRFKQRGMGFDAGLAGEQQAALRGAYDGFENLYDAIAHVEMSAFWGYAPVQFLADGELLKTLNLLDPWNVARDGLYGDWYWNAEAQMIQAKSLPPECKLDTRAYVFPTRRRIVNEIALVKYLRQNLSAKDWDAFLEIYGIPGWIVIMPQNVPAGKESTYEAAAKSVAEGGSGALPYGSSAQCADQPRGVSPFRDHLQYWSERLVLAGTGGLLTMLTASGSGTLAGSAHWEAFQIIARAEARKISELFQRSVDRHMLATNFPGRPALAYFDMAENEEQDPGTILDHAAKIKQAGGQVDWTQISEKTGYTITAAPPPAPNPFGPPGAQPGLFNRSALRNRSSETAEKIAQDLKHSAEIALSTAQQNDMAPLAERLRAILEIEDPALMLAALAKLHDELPDIARQVLASPESIQVVADTLSAAVLNGWAEHAASTGPASMINRLVNFDPSQARDAGGRWTEEGGGGLVESEDDAVRRTASVVAWAHRTGTTGAKEQAIVARKVRAGASLKDAVGHANRIRERQRVRALGEDLYRQMKQEGKLKELQV